MKCFTSNIKNWVCSNLDILTLGNQRVHGKNLKCKIEKKYWNKNLYFSQKLFFKILWILISRIIFYFVKFIAKGMSLNLSLSLLNSLFWSLHKFKTCTTIYSNSAMYMCFLFVFSLRSRMHNKRLPKSMIISVVTISFTKKITLKITILKYDWSILRVT